MSSIATLVWGTNIAIMITTATAIEAMASRSSERAWRSRSASSAAMSAARSRRVARSAADGSGRTS